MEDTVTAYAFMSSAIASDDAKPMLAIRRMALRYPMFRRVGSYCLYYRALCKSVEKLLFEKLLFESRLRKSRRLFYISHKLLLQSVTLNCYMMKLRDKRKEETRPIPPILSVQTITNIKPVSSSVLDSCTCRSSSDP